MIGQPIKRLLPPDRLDEEDGILDRIRRGERIEHFETVRRRKDGTELQVSLTISPIADPTARSSARRRSYATSPCANTWRRSFGRAGIASRSIFNAVSEGIFIVSPETGTYLEVNEAGCAHVRICPRRADRAQHLGALLRRAALLPADAKGWIEKAMISGLAQRFEWHCKAKDGHLFWAEISLRFTRIGLDNAVLRGSCATFTRRKAAEGASSARRARDPRATIIRPHRRWRSSPSTATISDDLGTRRRATIYGAGRRPSVAWPAGESSRGNSSSVPIVAARAS